MPRDSEPETIEIELDGPVTKSTEKAILINYEGETFWIPRKLIPSDSDVKDEGDEGTPTIPRWFAEKEGIE